jgi:hypothetical protein
MTQHFQSANYYREKVTHQIHHLEMLLHELKYEIPFSGPHKFAEATIELTKLLRDFFSSEMQKVRLDEDIIDRCKKYLNLIDHLNKNVVPFLQGVNETFIPSELLLTLADIIRELADKLNFSKNFDIRFYPRWTLNYGIYAYKDFIRTSLAEFPVDLFPEDPFKELPPTPEWFIFITYPILESRSILLHPLIIHEIGHLVDFQTEISKKIKEEIKLDKESFEDLFQKEQKNPKYIGLEETEIKENLYEKCMNITEKWLKELICDLIATHLLGPAYFFAFFELSNLNDDIYLNSEGHPSSGIRLRFISEELYQMSFITELKAEELKAFLNKWYKDLKNMEENGEFMPKGPGNEYFRVVYKYYSK